MLSNFEEKKKQLKALEKNEDIKGLLEEAYQVLGNPIVMFDTSYNLLACVDGVVTDDKLWNEITTQRTFSHETVDFFNMEHFIEAFAQSDTVVLMKSDRLKYDRMNGKLFDKDDVQLGNILVLACLKPFDEGDTELIEILCEILSVELQNSELYQKIDRVYQESLLNDLIDGNIQDKAAVKPEMAKLYGECKDNLYLAVVDITQYEHTVTHLAYFRDLFKKTQAEYRYFIHLNYIVIIISTDHPLLRIEKDLNKLNAFFVEYQIYAGVSSCFRDLWDLQKYYGEAINALNYGLKSMRNQHIFAYDNIRVEHFLHSAKNTNDISDLYNPVVFLIKEYDKENDTALLNLLYTYLLYGMDPRITCKRTGITRCYLNRQLKKMKAIFDIDWQNADMLIGLFLSIRLLE